MINILKSCYNFSLIIAIIAIMVFINSLLVPVYTQNKSSSVSKWCFGSTFRVGLGDITDVTDKTQRIDTNQYITYSLGGFVLYKIRSEYDIWMPNEYFFIISAEALYSYFNYQNKCMMDLLDIPIMIGWYSVGLGVSTGLQLGFILSEECKYNVNHSNNVSNGVKLELPVELYYKFNSGLRLFTRANILLNGSIVEEGHHIGGYTIWGGIAWEFSKPKKSDKPKSTTDTIRQTYIDTTTKSIVERDTVFLNEIDSKCLSCAEIIQKLNLPASGSLCLQGLKLCLDNEFLNFDKGKWDIKTQYRKNLDSIVEILNHPNFNNLYICIYGHTDRSGDIDFDNQKLSEQRASAVSNYLINSGVDKSFIKHIRGCSWNIPFDLNKYQNPLDCPTILLENRRVEIRFGCKEYDCLSQKEREKCQNCK